MKNRTLAIFASLALAASAALIGAHSAEAHWDGKIKCRDKLHCHEIWLRYDKVGDWKCNKHGCWYNNYSGRQGYFGIG